MCRYCGVKDPSWAEIRHFVKFLDLQLQSCERSIFCNEDFVGDVMAGLKSFVVKFMIRMSRVRKSFRWLVSNVLMCKHCVGLLDILTAGGSGPGE